MKKESLPRVSGGVSEYLDDLPSPRPSSPRKRGCFWERQLMQIHAVVFPA